MCVYERESEFELKCKVSGSRSCEDDGLCDVSSCGYVG
jgi:hypothetical protein